mgnify:CR=1 FL=1|tara:strand:- start:3118 stop:3642 length:525 start_codon:yes stop_codon:yes gene_type:complete
MKKIIKKNSMLYYDNKKIIDKRGFFFKIFNYQDFKKTNFKHSIKQVNISNNIKKGTVRGLHYQVNKFKEQKIITCLQGSIFDVLIDTRKSSSSYLKYFSVILSEKNQKILIIPPGFAHGYQTLEKNTKVLYLHSNLYSKKNERTINVLDKKININWPIKIKQISNKDKMAKTLK